MTKPNAVWIELEKPRDDAHAEEICAAANRMLVRLREPNVQSPRMFFWNDKRQCYEYGDAMGREELADRGTWFNLDYLGRK